jgi:Fe-S-cluster containining protein
VESLADASEENATIAQLAIPFYGPLAPNGIWYYTCKHFDGKNCTIYAHRPKMCRDYGVVTPCTHNGCTYEP